MNTKPVLGDLIERYERDSMLMPLQDQPLQHHPLPPNWVARVDPNTGRTYYANTVTNTTQWEFPQSSQPSITQQQPLENYEQSSPIQQGSQMVSQSQQEQQSQPLPPNWIACVDPNTGRTYYANTVTRTTQWEFPC